MTDVHLRLKAVTILVPPDTLYRRGDVRPEHRSTMEHKQTPKRLTLSTETILSLQTRTGIKAGLMSQAGQPPTACTRGTTQTTADSYTC